MESSELNLFSKMSSKKNRREQQIADSSQSLIPWNQAAKEVSNALELFQRNHYVKNTRNASLLASSTEIIELRERNLNTAYSVDDTFVKTRNMGFNDDRKRLKVDKGKTPTQSCVKDIERALQSTEVPEILSEFDHVPVSETKVSKVDRTYAALKDSKKKSILQGLNIAVPSSISTPYVPDDPSQEFKDYLALMVRKQLELRNETRKNRSGISLDIELDETAVTAIAVVAEELISFDLNKRKDQISTVYSALNIEDN